MKKLFIGIFAVFTIFLFTSCGANETSGESTAVNNTTAEETNAQSTQAETDLTEKQYGNYPRIELSNGFDHLENNTQKKIYNKVLDVVYSVEDEKTDDERYYLMETVVCDDIDGVTSSDMVVAFAAFKNDNPEYFWIDAFCKTDISPDTGNNMYVYSMYSPEQVSEMSSEFDNAVDKIFSSMPDNLSEYDRELFVHDKICEMCDYNDKAAEKGNDTLPEYYNAYNAYGVLIDGSAVCQGYSDAYTYLLSCVGVNNTQISNQEHIWNAVQVEGDWYNVDLTWDDTTDSYDYFNVTDEKIKLDHKVAPLYTQMTNEELVGTEKNASMWFNIYLPECTSTKYE